MTKIAPSNTGGNVVERRARGEARIEKLLAAAEAMIVEQGVGALVLSQVARRSGTAQGSLYQFFSSRDEMLLALHDRYARALESLAQKAEADFARIGSSATPGDLVRLLLSPMSAFYADHPAYAEIRRDATRGNPTAPRERQTDAFIADTMRRMLARLAPDMPDARLHLVTGIALETGDALLSFAASAERKSRKSILEEAQVMLETYLITTITNR